MKVRPPRFGGKIHDQGRRGHIGDHTGGDHHIGNCTKQNISAGRLFRQPVHMEGLEPHFDGAGLKLRLTDAHSDCGAKILEGPGQSHPNPPQPQHYNRRPV
ncbi:hypothetical protein D3C81_1521790 [compost metagenome]